MVLALYVPLVDDCGCRVKVHMGDHVQLVFEFAIEAIPWE
jgi:hypothetical protein